MNFKSIFILQKNTTKTMRSKQKTTYINFK